MTEEEKSDLPGNKPSPEKEEKKSKRDRQRFQKGTEVKK